jgi:low temperature requirement protein LtrA
MCRGSQPPGFETGRGSALAARGDVGLGASEQAMEREHRITPLDLFFDLVLVFMVVVVDNVSALLRRRVT